MRWQLTAAILLLATGHLLMCSSLLQLRKSLLLCNINNIVIRAPVGIIVRQLRHSDALPEPQLLLQRRILNPLIPARLIVIILATKVAQIIVCSGRMPLHLPYLLAQAAVFAAGFVELCAI